MICVGPNGQFQADPMSLGSSQIEKLQAMGAAADAGAPVKRILVKPGKATNSAAVAEILQYFKQAATKGRVLFLGAL
ncbi:MAG: hypothetical protein ACI84E_002010 [Planctomycetota bacterium]